MKYDNIFILTGAGISAESGLGTFRDRDGVWSRFDVEALATPQGFARDPVRVLEFYNLRRQGLLAASANAAHVAIAQLQQAYAEGGRAVTICTQNVDDLHEQGGARDVIHMHGELKKARCTKCEGVSAWLDDIVLDSRCPACARAGGMRPHVVWFGEMPLEMPAIHNALAKADLFVSIGTSGSVYPAAGFVRMALEGGADTMEINLEPSENGSAFHHVRLGPATEAVPAWVAESIAVL
jgi:NAD-dependent deacetylase